MKSRASLTATKVRRGAAAPRRGETGVIDLVPALLDLKSILVPVDFSPPSMRALRYAARFAQQFGARLTLVFVNEPVVPPDFANFPLLVAGPEAARAGRAKLEKVAREHGVAPRMLEKTAVRTGTAHREIVAAARKFKSDLIIIATHGYGAVKHFLLGSTAERVVRHAPCPVLVVREHEREFV